MHVTATKSHLRGAILLPTSACWVPHIHLKPWGFQSPKGQNEWIQIDSGMFFRVTLILWGKDASLGLLICIDFYMFIFLQFLVVSLF